MSAELLPRLWTVLAVLALCGALMATALAWRREREARGRLRVLTGTAPAGDRPGVVGRPTRGASGTGRAAGLRLLKERAGPAREVALVLSSVVFGLVVIGGVAGILLGFGGAYAVRRWLRTRARRGDGEPEASAEARSVEGHLPLAAELMAACLAAGSSPAQAADAVGRSTGGPLGDRLVRAASELRLGGEPGAVWGRFGALEGCAELARCMERAGTAGVPPVDAVSRLAAESRARRSRAATVRARRAGVLVTGPLGLCFLPAFLAVGVAPVVLGLARTLL